VSRIGAGETAAFKSVHLSNFPTGDPSVIDEALSEQMNLVREITSLGRNARNTSNLKVRQPLAKVEVVLADTRHQKWLEEHADLIADELNVKAVEFTTQAEKYITYSIVPNFKRLGPRLGKQLPAAKKALGEVDAGKMLAELKSAGKAVLKISGGDSVELDNEDIEVRLTAKEGWAAAQGRGSVVVLSTELTPELIDEGIAKDVIRLIQDQRKTTGCEYTDRIEVGLTTESADVRRAVTQFREQITQETLARNLEFEPIAGAEVAHAKIGDAGLDLYVRVCG
jgi:isoleucyl-tRNA synthetase